MHEMDKIFSKFLDRELENLDRDLLNDFDKLLDETDIDLLNWILGRDEVPEQFDKIISLLLVTLKEKF
tara:strand:- start:598 stop:801 length:204 start_codon:yes stop_codon:yes gene_type:complete